MRVPHRRRATALLALTWLLASTLVLERSAMPAEAQAARVHVSVRTFPALPAVGDRITARVSISGCPPGSALVETFITFDDGATQTSVRVNRTTARSSLLFTSTAIVTLDDAIEGWYGVRVVCGDFRPARAPMTNTMFVVGAPSTKTALVTRPDAAVGGTIGYHGTGCRGGSRVEYAIDQVERNVSPFRRTGDISVQPDGSWSANVTVPAELQPGAARLRARCVHELPTGNRVDVYYANDQEITLTPAPGGATPPASTSTIRPS